MEILINPIDVTLSELKQRFIPIVGHTQYFHTLNDANDNIVADIVLEWQRFRLSLYITKPECSKSYESRINRNLMHEGLLPVEAFVKLAAKFNLALSSEQVHNVLYDTRRIEDK